MIIPRIGILDAQSLRQFGIATEPSDIFGSMLALLPQHLPGNLSKLNVSVPIGFEALEEIFYFHKAS
jgi:hypothetical protein